MGTGPGYCLYSSEIRYRGAERANSNLYYRYGGECSRGFFCAASGDVCTGPYPYTKTYLHAYGTHRGACRQSADFFG